jgi:cytochrome P450
MTTMKKQLTSGAGPSVTAKLAKDALPAGLLPPSFPDEYVGGAVEPFLQSGIFVGETPSLPMIDLAFSKEEAVSIQLWGLLYDGWTPNPQEEGQSVFFQDYQNRGPNNERKKIYMSATTPDLIHNKYRDKIVHFYQRFLADDRASTPMMQSYFDNYFDLYWDLHVGATGGEIPIEVRQYSSAFSAVLGFWFPTLDIVQQNYMQARNTREALKQWLDVRVQAIADGKQPDADRTLVYYWLKNAGSGENFRRIDIIFECFHNFLALNQWGNMIYNVAAKLEPVHGDPNIQAWFASTMNNGPDKADGSPFTPLDRFVMEMFRVISPNGGSLSSMQRIHELLGSNFNSVLTRHLPTSMDARHWENPTAFDPDRYKTAPTSVDEARVTQMGLARCPFPKAAFPVKDGRKVEMTNGGFGAVYSEIDGTPHPVIDTAGYAPFGFGYRRCAGEHLTMEFIKEFLRTVWNNKLAFVKLDTANPAQLPVGPATVLLDNITFKRAK